MERSATRLIAVTVQLTCGAAAATIAALAFYAAAPSLKDWVAVLLFGTAVAVATNVELVTRTGSTSSAGLSMVMLASVVVFRAYSFMLGIALVGLAGGLTIRQIKAREWKRVAFNCAAQSLATVGAAALYALIVRSGVPTSATRPLLGVAAAALAILVFNSALVAVPVSLTVGDSYASVLHDFLRFDLGGAPFALLGLGVGWVYLELGAALLPVMLVPILLARRTFASYLQLRAAQEQTIETLIRALEAKDPYTAGHAQRVAMFSEYIGEELTLGPRRMERLRYAALMHDIGKLIVPNQLLNKPGRLTESEFARVRRHEHVSVQLLQRIDFLAPIAGDTTTEAASAAVRERTPIEPAIIHVADAFDAMTSTRSYRRALSQDTAFAELRKGADSQFNARCVEALIVAIERRDEHYGDGHETDQHEWAVEPPEAGPGSAGLGHLIPDAEDAPPAGAAHADADEPGRETPETRAEA